MSAWSLADACLAFHPLYPSLSILLLAKEYNGSLPCGSETNPRHAEKSTSSQMSSFGFMVKNEPFQVTDHFVCWFLKLTDCLAKSRLFFPEALASSRNFVHLASNNDPSMSWFNKPLVCRGRPDFLTKASGWVKEQMSIKPNTAKWTWCFKTMAGSIALK